MPSISYANLPQNLTRFIPLLEQIFPIVDHTSYVVIEIEDTTVENFKICLRETLARVADYPYEHVTPLDLGKLNKYELLSWWRARELGTRSTEINCCVIKIKGRHIPTKQYHVKFNFYTGLRTDTLVIIGDGKEPSSVGYVTAERSRVTPAISRPYNEEEFRAFHILKRLEAISGNITFTGTTLSSLPADCDAPNVPLIEDTINETPCVVML